MTPCVLVSSSNSIFKIHESIYAVFFSKTLHQFLRMLENPAFKIIGHANVYCTISTTGENVDIIAFLHDEE